MKNKKKVDPDHLSLMEKYSLYESAVQSPEGEVEIILNKYKEIRGVYPHSLREDFCGSSAFSTAWVKSSPKRIAYGVDLDPSPLEYAREYHYSKLKASQKNRLHLMQADVFEAPLPKVDVVVALNFSYFIFKEREQLVQYFARVKNSLNTKGIFVLDLFGGQHAHKVFVEKHDRGKFMYFWECSYFNPVNHHAKFSIHLKPHGKKKMENVFTYDWRIWSLPELRDILKDAGFSSTAVYWEEDDGNGSGNGEFYATEHEDDCLSWVSYIAAMV
jgi:SAM-dependent methyltransferase